MGTPMVLLAKGIAEANFVESMDESDYHSGREHMVHEPHVVVFKVASCPLARRQILANIS